jgi:hypothetical protein
MVEANTNDQRAALGFLLGILYLGIAGCNVSSAPSSTGGVNFDGQAGTGTTASTSPSSADATSQGGGGVATAGSASIAGSSAAGTQGAPGGATAQPVVCDRGVAIVTSDYKSTNIAISKLDGTTLSASFVSSGAAKPGLALAISGDVDVPFFAPASKRVVILDRYGTNVITWMDLTTASVIAQLPIGTGFEANPHDYLEIDDTYAYVSRYGTNMAPGVQPFDEGGDVLIVDTKTPAIAARIPIPESDATLLPRPDAMNWIGSYVALTMGRWSADYATVGDGRIVGISPATHQIAWQVDVTGLKACGRVALSPSRKLAAIACSGKRDTSTKLFDTTASDIVVYDATTVPPTEIRRLKTAVQLNSGIQPALTFANESTLLAKSYGGNATPGDHAFAVDVATGAITDLGETNKPYLLGGMHCSPGCGGVCILSDAERSKLRRWSVSDTGVFTPLADVTVDTVVGLPPRSIGSL